jgi:hypothetical protein
LQEPQPIDWEYYRKGIGSKVVDMYKEAYESKYPCTAGLVSFLEILKECFLGNIEHILK